MNRISASAVAAALGAGTLAGTAFLLNLPLWLGGGLAAAVVGGAYLAVRTPPRRGIALEPHIEAGRGLVEDGREALERLRASGRDIRDKNMKKQVADLVQIADRILNEIGDDPGKAMTVRRLLTFYLPNAASLAEGWEALEKRTDPPGERARQARVTMMALEDAFNRFANDLTNPQMDTLDLDLKVLNDSLRADVERTR